MFFLVDSYSSTIERKLTPKYDYILPIQEPTFTLKYIQTYKRDLVSGEYEKHNNRWDGDHTLYLSIQPIKKRLWSN